MKAPCGIWGSGNLILTPWLGRTLLLFVPLFLYLLHHIVFSVVMLTLSLWELWKERRIRWRTDPTCRRLRWVWFSCHRSSHSLAIFSHLFLTRDQCFIRPIPLHKSERFLFVALLLFLLEYLNINIYLINVSISSTTYEKELNRLLTPRSFPI